MVEVIFLRMEGMYIIPETITTDFKRNKSVFYLQGTSNELMNVTIKDFGN